MKAHKLLFSPTMAGLACLVACAAIVQGMINVGWIPALIVARPTDALAAFPELFREMDLFGAFLATLGTTAVATAVALAVGIPFGYLLYRNYTLGVAYEGWLAAAFSAPLVLLYPLFLVLFGRTYFTLVVMGAIPGSIPIIIQTRQGLLGVSQTLINVGRTFNMNEQGMFWKIMLPAAVPSIFMGIKIGVMYTLVNIVAIEYLVDFGGLGRVVSEMYFRFEIPSTYASILAVIAVSVLFYWGFGRIERWLRPV
jgi:ABC-type nitrate/sulfonate/bicarbonate transport system permease component